MPEHFGPHAKNDIGSFLQHRIFDLKKKPETKALSVCEALKTAELDAMKMRNHSGHHPIVNAAFRLEHAFYVELQAKVTKETTWEDLTNVVNTLIADNTKELEKLEPPA